VPERASLGSIRTRDKAPDLSGWGRDVALLEALGVLDPGPTTALDLEGVASESELGGWVSRLLSALARQPCASSVEPPLARRASFFDHLVRSLCWHERGERLLAPGDMEYLTQVEDREKLQEGPERLAASVLVHEGILVPSSDGNLNPNARLTRGQAVGILARTALRAGPPSLLRGRFRSVAEARLHLIQEGEEVSYPLDPSVKLFRSLDGTVSSVSEITLAAGDEVAAVLGDGGWVSFVQAEQNRLGIAADRISRYYRWEVRWRPEELTSQVSRYGSIGTVRDLVPRRVGRSGRIVELAVMGSEGEIVLSGLEIRRGLGVRENLFVIERERDPSGNVTRFVLTGKGWGHGVGLCQVGAYGMAEAGATYERILSHYYTGISLGPVAH